MMAGHGRITANVTGLLDHGEAKEGAEAFLDVLVANGLEQVFLMPGTDTFPIQEAIAKYQSQGRDTPNVVVCQHETTAVAAAHAYFALTGRPQLCLVHVDVGTQMTGGMVSNAQRGRAGLILCAGKTPAGIEGDVRGGRSREVHWLQDRADQAGIVRDYVKWTYDLTRPENLVHTVQRAFQVAASEPAGPVYLTLLRETLMQPAEFALLDPTRFRPAVSPEGDTEALRKIVRWLIASERPLLLTAYAGRNPETPANLAAFAELLAIPVVEQRLRVNLPTDHPLHLGFTPQPLLSEADVILLLDRDVPWIPRDGTPAASCRIAHVDIDVVKADIPIWGFPVDLPVEADSSKALPKMIALAEELLTDGDRSRIAARRERLSAAHAEQRTRLAGVADREAGEAPLSPAFVAKCVGEVLPDDSIVLDDAVTSSGVLCHYIESRRPHSFFKSGGSSMGWGQGAAIGAKLAAPDRTVVVLDADGNFVDSSPIAPLWAAERYGLPYLTVIFNNGAYNAVIRNLVESYPESTAIATANLVGMDLRETPDFAAIAVGCGAHGETVREPGELVPALQRALVRVHAGQAAVVDVHTRLH
jgi:acetolactate synthase-1/2/3 large subunit